MSDNDVEDLPVQGDSSGHDDKRSVSEGKEEQASGHSMISREMNAFLHNLDKDTIRYLISLNRNTFSNS